MNDEELFEQYWKANLLFRLVGVMGYSHDQAQKLKSLFFDVWKLAREQNQKH
jgi:hypothetical protein